MPDPAVTVHILDPEHGAWVIGGRVGGGKGRVGRGKTAQGERRVDVRIPEWMAVTGWVVG